MNSKYGFKLSDCKEWQWKDVKKIVTLIIIWTLLKKYWKILILIEPSIEKVLIIEHYWNINNIFSLLYWIVLNPDADAYFEVVIFPQNLKSEKARPAIKCQKPFMNAEDATIFQTK
jgi:hypothetical protein